MMRTTARGQADVPSVVFISHDAGRTGAPIMLLRLLRWLRAQRAFPFDIVLRNDDGELRGEFEKLGHVTVWPGARQAEHDGRRAWARAWRRPAPGATLASGIKVVYSNTITNGPVIDALASPGRTIITHVHELGHWIDHRIAPDILRSTLRHTNRYIAASGAVEAQLLQMGIPPSMIEVVYEAIDVNERPAGDARAVIRRRHGIPQDSFVVGGIGTTDWRKAPDIFIQVAAALVRARPDIDAHFLWLGGHSEGLALAELCHDRLKTGLQQRLHFVAAQPNPLDYLSAFDVLALTSREDPFPLVCLEAANVGKPIVCFGGAGGAPEFVGSDAGIVVPYLDVAAFAQALTTLSDDRAAAARLGGRGREKVQDYDVRVIGPRVAGIIEACLATQP